MSNLYTIPSSACFVSTLADGLWKRAHGDPMALASMVVYLPTRRACRHLREAFLRVTGANAALLPRMQPLGDVDEDDLDFMHMGALDDLLSAIPPLRRQMLLTKCVRQKDPDLPLEQAVSLAGSLAALLDQAQTEGCAFERLSELVPENYAQHWQDTLAFLDILHVVWPVVLKAQGCMDPAERRNHVLQKQAEAWTQSPPDFPIIAAGSTGSHPAVGQLMAVIADLPQGEVILPGLDLSLDEEAWQDVDETHPQFTMKQWLTRSELKRSDVDMWADCSPDSSGREKLLQEAMRPASVTDGWQDLNKDVLPKSAFDGMACLTLEHHREEADVIALRLRAALETKGQTAALISSDRALTARVAAALGRWGIVANDSAGTPLNQWPVGSFLLAVLQASVPDVSPVSALTLLKHPLASAGVATSLCRKYARQTEMKTWRGVRPKGSWLGAAEHMEEDNPECALWLKGISEKFSHVTDNWFEPQSLDVWLTAHLSLTEALAATDDASGGSVLWRNEDGEAAVAWLGDLRSAAQDMDALTGAEYAALLTALMRQVPVRPSYGAHPRLSLLGPLEARLLHHDFVILGGLNEATWPPAPPIDPWLSRPMKKAFGLPAPERRIGLSAHDFVQLVASADVLLTRAQRVGGSPTVPSRFWLQIEAVTQAAGHVTEECLTPSQPWREWAQALDEPNSFNPIDPPRPMPPVEARPNSLRATEISAWMRNPYAIYAKHILKLRKLDEIDAEVSAADFGTVIHSALEVFIKTTQKAWPEDPLALLLEKGQEAFAPFIDRPQVMAFWWPRFESMASWFVSHEEERRALGIKPALVEGDATLSLLNDAFFVRGRVDRIDKLADGALAIIDYKTGQTPSEAEVLSGYEPQLSLMALMAEAGAFDGLAPSDIGALDYWALTQRKDKDKVKSFKKDIEGQMVKAKKGLEHLVQTFSDPQTPYEAEPKPKYSPRYNDYTHLARLAEWGRVKGGGS